jgi:hypothetical protein
MYIGPDVLMPVASAIAAVTGFVLMFWRRIVGSVRLMTQKLTGQSRK